MTDYQQMSYAHIRIINEYFRLPEFIDFIKSPEYGVFQFLQAHIIRDLVWTGKRANIYNNYTRKGMLCSRYSQSDIGKYFGWGKSYVSRLITKLEKRKVMKKIYKTDELGTICVYDFGKWENIKNDKGETVRKEYLYLDHVFGPLAEKRRDEKMKSEERDPEQTVVNGTQKIAEKTESATEYSNDLEKDEHYQQIIAEALNSKPSRGGVYL